VEPAFGDFWVCDVVALTPTLFYQSLSRPRADRTNGLSQRAAPICGMRDALGYLHQPDFAPPVSQTRPARSSTCSSTSLSVTIMQFAEGLSDAGC